MIKMKAVGCGASGLYRFIPTGVSIILSIPLCQSYETNLSLMHMLTCVWMSSPVTMFPTALKAGEATL